MAVRSLVELYKKFDRESDWLIDVCTSSISGIALHDATERFCRSSGEMAVIRLHDAWARFCRQLIITSASCKPYTSSGIRLQLAPNIRKSSDVIPVLLKTYTNRKYEPKWYNSFECIDAAKRIQIQNISTVSSALGSVNSPSEEIRVVRNFFAHRGRDTADAIRQYKSLSHITRINMESIVGDKVYPGILRFESWVNELRLIAMAAVS